MSALEVNQDKCNSCGICVLTCPIGIIQMDDANTLPLWIQNGGELCIKCGHCVATCPTDAIAVDSIRPEVCDSIDKGLLPSPEQVELLIKSRRSIRVYKEDKVPRDILAKLVDIARYAPSGHNMQPVNWLIIEDSNEVKRLAGFVADWMRATIKDNPGMAQAFRLDRLIQSWDSGKDTIMRSAPHAIVAYGHKANPIAPQAGVIALTTLELAAYAQDLGACWAGYFHAAAMTFPPMIEALNLPEDHQCLGAMMIGYPKHKYLKIPTRNEPQIIWR